MFDGGEPSSPISKQTQPLDFIKIPSLEKVNFSAEMAADYQNGLSLADVAAKYGCSKHLVRSAAKKHSVKLRPNRPLPTNRAARYGSKGQCKPYFGFCYSEGVLTKHPVEFPILQAIHQRWKSDNTIHQIVCELNKKGWKSRQGKVWSWAAVQNIVKRFIAKKVVLTLGGKYEFR